MSLSSHLQALKKIVNQSQQNQKEARNTFKKFQIKLIKVGHKLTNLNDLKVAMEGLEVGARIAMNMNDVEMFDRVIIQLKQYYLIDKLSSCSSSRSILMGLYLMYLLTKNRLGDFHVEIELLSFDDLENKFIKFPMNIEQFMMEGSYQKIIAAKNNVPDKTYDLFLSYLEKTVRNEISKSLQSVHDKIPLKDALKMLSLNSVDDLKQYIKNEKHNWAVNVNSQTLQSAPTEEKA
eukprot:224937_1